MLEIRDLVKIYPGTPSPTVALKGVTIAIPNGLFGLLGPNGAGKSTLMNIVAGLLEPTGGSVTLDGVDIVKDPRRVWSRLGYLPQDFGFYPHLTGAQTLDMLLRLKGVDAPGGRKRLVQELLERVNLADAAKRRVKGYSGGMRQRLGIAQAIAGNPRLLIVDEPTAGLDPDERMRFYRLFAELGRERIVLLSTHIVEDVATLCPRLAIIRGGRAVLVSETAVARAGLDGTMYEGIVEDDGLAAVRASHRVTQAYLQEGSRHRVRVHAADGEPPAGFVPVPPTLEDVYFVAMRQAERSSPAVGSAGGGAA